MPLPESTRPRPTLSLRHSARVAVLEWTDAAGPHRIAVSDPVTVGSAPSVDVRIDDATVSRVHLEIDPREDGVRVRDFGSTNGTHANTIAIEHATLLDDTALRLGDTTLWVRRSDDRSDKGLWPSRAGCRSALRAPSGPDRVHRGRSPSP